MGCEIFTLSLFLRLVGDNFLDFVGITEEYEKSLNVLSHKYNWEPPIVEKRNVGNRPKTADFPKKLIAQIEKRNVLDIELYNYAFKLLKNK